MTRKVLSIISILKPIDDCRQYEKFGLSLSNTNKYAINIIGFSAKIPDKIKNITFFPVFDFPRNNIQRLGASWKIHKLLLKQKPELIIANSPEILPVICLNRILFGTKIFYDVQEDYYRNIRFTNTWPGWIRLPLALLVRLIEFLSAPFIDTFLLAENIYRKDIPFMRKKGITVLNKCHLPAHITGNRSAHDNEIRLIYTGTISRHYGIFDAITFSDRLYALDDRIRLSIVGYCAHEETWQQLIRAIENKSYITLLGGNRLVPHQQLLSHLANVDYCLLPYQPNKSTAGRIPTKVYECLALKIPMIIRHGASWTSLCNQHQASISTDFKTVDKSFMDTLLNTRFYTGPAPKDIYWQSEETKLLDAIQKALH